MNPPRVRLRLAALLPLLAGFIVLSDKGELALYARNAKGTLVCLDLTAPGAGVP